MRPAVIPMTDTQTTQTPEPRPGFVGHTELASTDPEATRSWCETALGWEFGDPVETPNGDYHMWRNIHRTGGGIRKNNPPEQPGTVPYVEVPDIQVAFDKCIAEGATALFGPDAVPDGSRIAMVKAPGGVTIGLWAPN